MFPILAQSYTYSLAQTIIEEYYSNFLAKIRAGDENFKPLKILHHFSAGLKGLITSDIHSSLTTLRETCGGAGFLQYGGLATLCEEFAAQVQYEGDNTVMKQQCAKLIIEKLMKGKKHKFPFL